jgi:hypothetical protein
MDTTLRGFSDDSVDLLSENDLRNMKGQRVYVFYGDEIDEGVVKIKDGSVHIVNSFFDYYFIDGKPAQGASFKAFKNKEQARGMNPCKQPAMADSI